MTRTQVVSIGSERLNTRPRFEKAGFEAIVKRRGEYQRSRQHTLFDLTRSKSWLGAR